MTFWTPRAGFCCWFSLGQWASTMAQQNTEVNVFLLKCWASHSSLTITSTIVSKLYYFPARWNRPVDWFLRNVEITSETGMVGSTTPKPTLRHPLPRINCSWSVQKVHICSFIFSKWKPLATISYRITQRALTLITKSQSSGTLRCTCCT